MPEVLAERAKMEAFAEAVHNGEVKSASGARFTDIVNIGIGGSDLGPATAALALATFVPGHLRLHTVANVDGADLGDTLMRVPLETTLFIVCSKTFTTIETMTNAATARKIVADTLGEAAVVCHFCAVSTQLDKITAFGIGGAQIWRGLNNNTRLFFRPRLFVLAEAGGYERRDCLHCLCRLGAGRGNGDGHSRPGAQGQNAHNRGPADGFPATADRDSDIEPIDTLHEFRRRARVEPLAIGDFKGAYKGIPGRLEIRTSIPGVERDGIVLDHFPLNTRLAT